jgi:ABC-type antimicrobial peptide transport system permease subunit
MFGIQSAFTVPWWQVGLGLAFTALVCLLAGLGPARHAARNNVVDAMRSI